VRRVCPILSLRFGTAMRPAGPGGKLVRFVMTLRQAGYVNGMNRCPQRRRVNSGRLVRSALVPKADVSRVRVGRPGRGAQQSTT